MRNNENQSDTKFMHIVYISSHQTTAKIHVKQQFGMWLCLQINSLELYIVKYYNSNSWGNYSNDESIKFTNLLVRKLKLSALVALSIWSTELLGTHVTYVLLQF